MKSEQQKLSNQSPVQPWEMIECGTGKSLQYSPIMDLRPNAQRVPLTLLPRVRFGKYVSFEWPSYT
jgi:hypothetical protein